MPAQGASHSGFSVAHLPWLIAGAIAGYLLVMLTNPARTAFRDGWRATRRYPVLWLTFGAFGFASTLFQLAIRIYSYCVLPPGDRPVFMWLRAAWRDPNFWLTGSPEPDLVLRPNFHSAAALINGVNDPEIDAVLDKERNTADPAERLKVLQTETFPTIAKKAPSFSLFSAVNFHGMSKKVQGVYFYPNGPIDLRNADLG